MKLGSDWSYSVPRTKVEIYKMASMAGRLRSTLSIWPLVRPRRFGVLILPLLYLICAAYCIAKYSFNWPNVDDFGSIDQFSNYYINKTFTLMDLFLTHDGAHPTGTQVVLTVLMFRLFGINFFCLIIMSFLVSLLSVIMLWLQSKDFFRHKITGIIAPILLMAVAFHPVQTNHFIWSFEFGWFLINMILVAIVFLLERYRSRGFILVYFLLLIATFCLAQAVVLWFCALLHIWLLPAFKRRWMAISAVAFGLIIDAVAILHITPADEGVVHIISFSDFAVYVLSIVGCIFSIRNETVLPLLGATISVIAGISLFFILTAREISSLDRIAASLMIGSLGYLAVFVKGRYQNGLSWALSAFHAGPLFVPLLFGFVLVAVRCWQTESYWPTKTAGLSIFALVTASVVSSMPYMRERGQDSLTREAFAMHVTCFPGYSRRVVLNANLNEQWSALFDRTLPLLKTLCTADEPDSARYLEQIPLLFKEIIRVDPASRDPLNNLWDVYVTHFDLQHAFPPGRIADLLTFAHNNAIFGSKYAPEELKTYETFFKSLH